jgi:hypothetical protein
MTPQEFIQNQENQKFDFIKRKLPDEFSGKRFDNVHELISSLEEWGLINSWDKESIKLEEQDIIDQGCMDYCLTFEITPYWGYVDVYYLYDLQAQVVIIEIAINKD